MRKLGLSEILGIVVKIAIGLIVMLSIASYPGGKVLVFGPEREVPNLED